MKKKLVVGVVAAALACLGVVGLYGCGGSSDSGSSSTASSDVAPADNTLVVGFDQSYPPYGYKDTETGEYTGVDLDLAQAVCEKNGWEFKAEPIDWDAKDALVNQGDITCIWNGFTYEGREGKYAFSGQYMINGQVIVVKADSGITDFAALKDKTVITQVDSAALDVLNGDQKDLQSTFKDGEVQTIADYNNAFMQLESGAVDAVACDLSIAAYQMAAKEGVFAQLDETLSSEHYAVGFKLGDEGQALADKVTETLKELDQEGKVKEICEKYAEQGISYENWCLE